jgi:hypothetical protein
MISFLKPENWMELPMFKKIYYYGTQLTKEYSEYVDKLEAKRKVKEICGNDIKVAKVVRILKSYDDLTENDLNKNYIIKSSHGSNWNIYNDESIPITLNNAIQKLRGWNNKYNSYSERQYNFIEPKFFVEEKICDSILGYTGHACVYMFRCIYSNPISIGVKYKKMQNSYDINWNLTQKPKIPFQIPKPKCLSKLLNLCKILSSKFEFVRLDFYIGKDDVIYFSEFTFTPAGGCQVFDNETEIKQGLMWV